MTKVSKMLTVVIMAITLFASSFSADAIPAYPGLISFMQPDGSTIHIYLKGDEKVKWAETEDGYSILFDAEGYYEYAVTDSKGDLTPSGVIAKNIESRTPANLSFLSTITKHNRYSTSQISMAKQIWDASNPVKSGAKSFPTTGTRKLLLILANFNNTTTTYTQVQFNNYMNQANYNGTGSFKDFFYESSYGALTMTTTVTAWVTLPNTHDYYGPQANWGEFAYDAIVAANSTVNFSQFDNDGDGTVDGVAIIHQGPGQESTGSTNDIWSHSSGLAGAYTTAQRTFDGVKVNSYTAQPEIIDGAMTTIGVMCHEFGHNLGAPDFYDTDYDDTGNGQYEGTGNWDLQAGGSWNNGGKNPPHPNAYTKCYIYNWATPTILTTGQTVTLRNSTKNKVSFYRFNTPTTNEFFLLENKQKVGFDYYVPGHGLIIYHVDGSYVTSHSSSNDINVSSHQGLFIIPANSTVANGIAVSASTTLNTTGATYPGTSSKTTFTDATTPNSKSWASANTAKPITAITEITSDTTIVLNFMGGYSCTTPTAQATAFTSSALANNSMTIGWTRGTGTSVMVVAKASSAVNTDPFNGTTYTANAAFGTGTQIGTGNYVVYNGTGTSVNVTGLNPGTAYYYAVYEYTLATTCYKTPALTGNATTTGTAPCTACVPSSTTDDATGITNVTFSTINSTSTGDNAYTDNSATIASVTKAQAYPLSVKVNTGGNYTSYTKAWIDWNHDCTFDATTEEYNLGTVTNVTDGLTASSPLSITIPSTALTGNTKMRVRSTYYDGTATTLPTACNDQSYSEAEDYTLNVVSGVCTPVAVTTQPATTQSACAPGGASFTVVAATGTAPITYQWQYYNGSTWNSVVNGTPAGATYTNGTAATMTVAGITAATTYQYRCYLTNCSGANNATSNTASLVINATPTAPTVGTITQPTCATATGSVVLNGLPATGTWTLTKNPGATTTSGTGTSKTITGLTAGTYTYTVTNASTCVSTASANVVINAQPATPTAPTVGTITQPTCATATGNVILSGLPTTGTWTLSRTPGGITTTGTGTTSTISGLAAGTYTYTVTNASTCVSTASANVVINAQPATPTAPTVGTITQPTCAVNTGSVVLNGLPSTGTWTLTKTPGATTTTGTGTSKTITGLAAGTYTYTVTNANTCVSPASANIVIIAATGTPTVAITNNTGSTILTCTAPSISVTATPAGATSYSWNSGTSTTTAANNFTSAGTYTVTVTATGGCTAISSITITQNTTPPTPAIINNGPVCVGNNLLFTGNGGATYSWSGPNGFASNLSNPTITGATGTAAGVYTATVTGTNGCTATGQTSVVINPIPVSQFTYNASGLTVTFTNTSTNATSYSWNFGGSSSTTTSPVYTFPSNGQYTVTLTAITPGCSSTSTQIINVVGDGIATNYSQSLTIYPNPAHGVITIHLDAESNTKLLSIYDVTGRMVYQKTLHSLKEDINLSQLNYGVYEVKINLDNRILHQRLILK